MSRQYILMQASVNEDGKYVWSPRYEFEKSAMLVAAELLMLATCFPFDSAVTCSLAGTIAVAIICSTRLKYMHYKIIPLAGNVDAASSRQETSWAFFTLPVFLVGGTYASRLAEGRYSWSTLNPYAAVVLLVAVSLWCFIEAISRIRTS
jgi:hypothetical protein